MKELKEIKQKLEEIIERKYIRLWRLARRAENKGCSPALVNAIRNEGWEIYHMRNYPERILTWQNEYTLKYAFKAI